MERWFVAVRYLLARPISLVSLLGVMVGVMAVVVVDSVMNGFLGKHQATVRGTTPDVVVRLPKELRRDEAVLEDLLAEVAGTEGVASASARILWPGLYRKAAEPELRRQGGEQFVQIVAVDPGAEAELLRTLVSGSRDPRRHQGQNLMPPRLEAPLWFEPADPYWATLLGEKWKGAPLLPVLFGEKLASSARLEVGDVITLGGFGEPVRENEFPVFTRYFVVTGTFVSLDDTFEATHAFVPRAPLLESVELEERAREIAVHTTGSPERVQALLRARVARFGVTPDLVETWREQKKVLLRAIENERAIMNFVLFFLILIAGFNLLVTLYMMVSEKTRDVGLLTSMGASPGSIATLFLACGLIVSVAGCLLGLCGGLLVTASVNTILDQLAAFGVYLFHPVYYGREPVPTDVQALRILRFLLLTLACTTLFTLLPSWQAGRMEAVEALRRE